MNDVVSTFPLLRLSKQAILNTLRIMDLLHIFGISILSEKTKNLVESLKLTSTFFQVDITDVFRFRLVVGNYSKFCFQLYHVLENEPLQELKTPPNVRLLHKRKVVTWTNSMSVKQLLDHLNFIFHNTQLSRAMFFDTNCERFSLESVHKHVKDFKTISILSGNQEHNRRILDLFEPASLTVSGQALVNFRVPRNILLQNLNVLHEPNVHFALDDLLLTNCRYINLQCRNLSAKVVNQFLKLWAKGSNPRLECLFLQFPGNLQLEELLSGLKYQNAPNGVRLYKTAGVKNPVNLRNGRDIWRFDGTKATIFVANIGDRAKFGFYGLHDHCVVN